MNKAVVVVNMPERCIDCMFSEEYEESGDMYCLLVYGDITDEPPEFLTCHHLRVRKPEKCPLRPLPKKINITKRYHHDTYNEIYRTGYNKCIDDITKE